jgi:hypothetical protein
MNILFIIERGSYYKFYSPVIEEALKRNHTVYVIHNYHQPYPNAKNPKSFYFPFLNLIPQFCNGTVIPAVFRRKQEVSEFIKENRIDSVFSLHPRSRYMEKAAGINWYCLQHGQDGFQDAYGYSDEEMFIYSKEWVRQEWIDQNPDVKLIVAGAYHYHKEDFFDSKMIKQKYALPDKKIFLYIPLDSLSLMRVRNPVKKLYLYYIYLAETKILKQIKNFCDKYGYHIVIKSRFKRMLPEKYKQYGTILYDESFYPATIEELVSAADIVLSDFYYSTTVAEAAFHRSKYITITYDYLEDEITWHHKSCFSDRKWKDLFLPEGLNYLIKSSDFNSDSLVNIMNEKYNIEKGDLYVRKYLCPQEKEPVCAIMDYVEQECKGQS